MSQWDKYRMHYAPIHFFVSLFLFSVLFSSVQSNEFILANVKQQNDYVNKLRLFHLIANAVCRCHMLRLRDHNCNNIQSHFLVSIQRNSNSQTKRCRRNFTQHKTKVEQYHAKCDLMIKYCGDAVTVSAPIQTNKIRYRSCLSFAEIKYAKTSANNKIECLATIDINLGILGVYDFNLATHFEHGTGEFNRSMPQSNPNVR